ncbi:MAG TPA: outer membrane beta-barrel protein [Blastocatellia bacterium]|nr:outer membrane beta-barrel protein [Blastocatellia bacterium]
MRFVLSIAFLLIALSTPALAQEPQPVEVFGGYSFFRPDGGGNLHGWDASVAFSLNRRIAIVGDFSGHYGSQSIRTEFINPLLPGTVVVIDADSDSSIHNILAGPKIRFPIAGNEDVTPFAHVLLGASRLGADATVRFGDLVLDSKFSDISFAIAVGGGLDVKLSDSVALRVIQADYLVTNFGGNSQGNVRLSVGLVLH